MNSSAAPGQPNMGRLLYTVSDSISKSHNSVAIFSCPVSDNSRRQTNGFGWDHNMVVDKVVITILGHFIHENQFLIIQFTGLHLMQSLVWLQPCN